jgi:hypothetical protein
MRQLRVKKARSWFACFLVHEIHAALEQISPRLAETVYDSQLDTYLVTPYL